MHGGAKIDKIQLMVVRRDEVEKTLPMTLKAGITSSPFTCSDPYAHTTVDQHLGRDSTCTRHRLAFAPRPRIGRLRIRHRLIQSSRDGLPPKDAVLSLPKHSRRIHHRAGVHLSRSGSKLVAPLKISFSTAARLVNQLLRLFAIHVHSDGFFLLAWSPRERNLHWPPLVPDVVPTLLPEHIQHIP